MLSRAQMQETLCSQQRRGPPYPPEPVLCLVHFSLKSKQLLKGEGGEDEWTLHSPKPVKFTNTVTAVKYTQTPSTQNLLLETLYQVGVALLQFKRRRPSLQVGLALLGNISTLTIRLGPEQLPWHLLEDMPEGRAAGHWLPEQMYTVNSSGA